MPYTDHQKQIEYKRTWNKKYYALNRKAEKERILKRKKKIAKWIEEYKANLKCQLCEEKTTICLEFHHLNPSKKDFNLGMAKNWGWGIERVRREIKKCAVLCANCHRKVHAGLIKI